jgi:hypothetical protein
MTCDFKFSAITNKSLRFEVQCINVVNFVEDYIIEKSIHPLSNIILIGGGGEYYCAMFTHLKLA